MKLIIQIPCYNEADTLPQVLKEIPSEISGISSIEVLVIDDGSSDGTFEVAKQHGVDCVLRNTANLGLARTFKRGLDEALKRSADIIVNLDGDHQYSPADIPRLVQPLLGGTADIVIGNRQTDSIQHFSTTKKLLQKSGSAIVRWLSHTSAIDTTSGFRAFTRAAALRITILSNYTYTLESILQASSKGLKIANIDIETNPPTRESRLIRSIRSYLAFSIATILRTFTMYNPLRVFLAAGIPLISLGGLLIARFLYFYFSAGGQGKIQSLVIAAILMTAGVALVVVGLISDLIQFNRRLLEDILERVRKVELTLNDS